MFIVKHILIIYIIIKSDGPTPTSGLWMGADFCNMDTVVKDIDSNAGEMAKISIKNGQMIDQDSKAYQGLCQMLFNNELNPGQKIAYKDLADRLGVSTTPVIHALKLMEFKGIVRREPNKGYFINTISLQEIEEIFDARLALEVSILPKTLAHLDDEGLETLEKALAVHDRAVAENNYFGRVMSDLRFHMTLASLSQTRIQVILLEELFDRLLLKYSKDLFMVSIIDSSQSEHYRIIDAIRDRDLPRMSEALTHHLKVTKTHIIRGLAQLLNGEGPSPGTYHSFEDIRLRDEII